MAKLFSFSQVNSLRDIDSNRTRKTCLTFEKYILNKHHKNQEQNKTSSLTLIEKTNINQQKCSKIRYLEDEKQQNKSCRLLGRVKSLNSILMNKQMDQTNQQEIITRPSSMHKKVCFKDQVIVIDMGVKKNVKLIERESKLRNGYFVGTLRTQ